MRQKNSVLILALLLTAFLVPPAMRAEAPTDCQTVPAIQEPQLVLTDRFNDFSSESEFECHGLVYGYVMFPEPLSGEHVLESTWIRPDKQVKEDRRMIVNFPPPGRKMVYVWLRFDDQTDSPLSRIYKNEGISPSFNGQWEIDVQLDGKPLKHSQFKVKC